MASLSATGSTSSVTGDGEASPSTTAAEPKRGGWTTTPFIIATVAGLTLAAGGSMSNLIVFLIQQFNIKSINAAQINNVVNGCTNFFPVIGAIVADSFLGCFTVIWISSLISLLGLILLVLTVTIDGLKPPVCETGSSNLCVSPSGIQYTVLFAALALVSIGLGGTQFTLATMGANQFTKIGHRSTYFNWYFFVVYLSSFISATAIVYVEDNLNWPSGFGLSIAFNVLGLAFFLAGKRFYYRQDKPKGSPFTSLLRVAVASFRKRKLKISFESAVNNYHYGVDGIQGRIAAGAPTKSFRLLNRAAIKTEGDHIEPNKHPWKLCTVQQVEDLKTLIRIIPLWSTGIFLSTPIGIQLSLIVLQALTTDRHVAPGLRFQIPAGSVMVFSLISSTICIVLKDHCLWPLWKKLTKRDNIPTPLQQIGIGHVFNIASMAVAALVESKRRGSHRPMSVLWLVPQMVIVGTGQAFHFPGQVALYYQEFPNSLKSVSTAMVALLIAIAFYLSTAVIDLIRRVTVWLPDDINHGRLDCVYWVMTVLGVFNFGYYLACSCLYSYKKVEVVEGGDQSVVLD